MKRILLLIAALFMLGTIIYGILSFTQILNRTNTVIPKINLADEELKSIDKIPKVSIVAENLEVPWALAFLPDKSILVTQRSGIISIIKDGEVSELGKIDVHNQGEGGLHGIAIDPDFNENSYIYVYYTTDSNDENSTNRVARFTLENNSLNDETVILDEIPGARIHDGGRIKFGPDNLLYITTGDAAEPSLSQNRNSLAGKILRINKDGTPASGNPFNTAIYSYGHRNPQGITWDNNAVLYATEHGNNTTDEFNMIEIGKNYGWPNITGSESAINMTTPLLQSGNNTWAPAGLAYADGKFYFGGLRGNALFSIEEINGEYMLTEYFKGEFGRIRDVIKGPDNMLYITTSNRDGRGIESENDDKVIRINPFIL